jgi:threonine dehydratase
MGSGICGLISARDALGLKTEIIGVSAEKAPAMARSVQAGKPMPMPSAATFADGLATREPVADAISAIIFGAKEVLTVSEDEIAEAVRVYYDDTHQAVEGAGAAPLAALMKHKERWRNRKVGVVLSGGNIERQRFLKILSGQTPGP